MDDPSFTNPPTTVVEIPSRFTDGSPRTVGKIWDVMSIVGSKKWKGAFYSDRYGETTVLTGPSHPPSSRTFVVRIRQTVEVLKRTSTSLARTDRPFLPPSSSRLFPSVEARGLTDKNRSDRLTMAIRVSTHRGTEPLRVVRLSTLQEHLLKKDHNHRHPPSHVPHRIFHTPVDT